MNPHTRLSIAALISGALLIPPSGGHTAAAHEGSQTQLAPPASVSTTH